MASPAAFAGYAVSGIAMAGMTWELYNNFYHSRGMNVRVRRVEVPADAMLRKLPSDWLTSPTGKVIGTDCWATAPRHPLKLKGSSAASSSASSSSTPAEKQAAADAECDELLLLYANSIFQSPAFAWEIFLTNLKNGKFQWSQPWTELKEGEAIGSYTVSKRTPTEVMLQWTGNAVDGQTSISIHPDQPAALFQLGATLYKRDALGKDASENSNQSATNAQMKYLRMVLAQTYTTMDECSKAALAKASSDRHAADAKSAASAGKPPGM